MKTEIDNEAKDRKDQKSVTVTFNERLITFSDHKATGLEIKRTAIQQSIAIQEDFVLFEVKGESPLKQVGDTDRVTLHKGQVFCAVAPDDNS